ncbi:MAG: OmpA family protein [Planctomycetes bacterium]|nr:OmpA family protein [Planctomycetota bacterium]
MYKLSPIFLVLALAAAGCSNTEPLEDRIVELNWQIDSAEQASEQSTVDKRLAQRELELSQKGSRVLKERLALAYDALREARTRLDERLPERVNQLAESHQPGAQKLEISQYGGVVLESGVLFGGGRHELTKAGKRALQPMVTTLLKDEYDSYEIEVSGHSDTDPIKRSKGRYRDNWDLAAMRANSVRRFLVQQGVPTERLTTSSYGYHRPIEKGNKARNRRVEISLRKKMTSLPASAPR